MLLEMSKIRIIGLKAVFPQTLDALYSFGKIQFDDLAPAIEAGELPLKSMAQPEGREEEIAEMTAAQQRSEVVCQGLYGDEEQHLPADQDNPLFTAEPADLITQSQVTLDRLEPQVKDLAAQRQALEDQQAELEKYKPVIAQIAPIIEHNIGDSDKGLDALVLLIEKRNEALIKTFEPALQEISSTRTKVIDAELANDVIPLVVVFDKKYSSDIWAYLKDTHANQMKLPEDLEDVPLPEAIKHLQGQIEAADEKIAEINDTIKTLGADSFDELVGLKDALHDRLQEFEATKLFAETEYTFVVEGYVPKSELPALISAVGEVSPDVMVDEEPITPAIYPEVPVEIEKKKGRMNAFRAAIGLWGTPQYGQLDPTTILAISFPFIFGMIVGDAGYGLLMVIFCLVLRKKMPDSIGVQNITGVLFPAGIMTMIFGCFYFEFFGNLAHEYIPFIKNIHPIEITSWFTLPFLRTETNLMNTLLFLAIGVGVLEVAIGLVIGIINSKKGGHTKHIFEKAGILMIIFAALLMVVSMMMPAVTAALGATGAAIFKYAAYVILAFGLISALFGGGIMGAIETLEAVTHSASYIRIMAVGLVGALLADAANDLMFKTMPNIGGLAIGLILHILNFAIILFSPSIHALRLTFLEFFGNFFERGSRQYKPFARAGKEERL